MTLSLRPKLGDNYFRRKSRLAIQQDYENGQEEVRSKQELMDDAQRELMSSVLDDVKPVAERVRVQNSLNSLEHAHVTFLWPVCSQSSPGNLWREAGIFLRIRR
jgi:hypothetical protein